MMPGLMVQLLLKTARVLGQAGKCPKEAIFFGQGFLGNPAYIYNILSPETIDFDNLPSDLKLTRSDMVELARKFDSLLRSCERCRVLFRDPRGTGINLAAQLFNDQTSLLCSIVKRLGLLYEAKELGSGMGIMLLVLDLLDLFDVNMNAPSVLYLNSQEGCVNGSPPLGTSLEGARLSIECELNEAIRQVQQISTNIWRLAFQEGVATADGIWVTKINLRTELSSEIEFLCDLLIELLADIEQKDDADESSDEGSAPPEIEGEGSPESSDPITEETQDQLGLS